MISETAKLELAPFDVKVITCITGAVKTNIMTNCAKAEIDSTSLYVPVTKAISDRALGKDVQNPTAPHDFAAKLVDNMLNGATGRVY